MAAYEDEVVLCAQSSSRSLRNDAINILAEMGTAKSVGPLQALKARLNTRTDRGLIDQIDKAVQAIQARAKPATGNK